MIKTTLAAMIRPLVEQRLPASLDVRWFTTREEAIELAGDAEIAWLDMVPASQMMDPILAATNLKWLNSIYAGVDPFPLDALAERGTVLTNGVGVNTIPVAEYAVAGMLSAAKGFPDVTRAADRREWLWQSPGTIELFESKALIVGMGAIGSEIARRLESFGVEVTGVRRTPAPGVLQPHEWQARIGEFDWVILAAPATDATKAMIGAAELAAMKPSAWLVNIARGSVVDQDALVAALASKSIAGAFLDVTDPEPLPADHPLWALPNAIITMHLSGRATTRMFQRSAQLFLANLDRYLKGEPLHNRVDLAAGY